MLDQPQPVEFVFGVHAHAADRPRRPYQSQSLVLAQRLRVHVQQTRSHADKVKVVVDRHGSGRVVAYKRWTNRRKSACSDRELASIKI
jgi:hypothetical protein